MQRTILKRMTLLFAVLAMWACGGGDDLGSRSSSVYAQGTQCQTLYAGQTLNAGSVCVSVVGQNLNVTYNTTGGWELTVAHLWVGDALATMPQTKTGNPQIGKFPYNSGDITGTSYTFSIPLASLSADLDLCGHTFAIAAHAGVRKANGEGGYQTETGWADGTQIQGRGSWATYFSYTITCTTDPPPPMSLTCDTAFAFGNKTLIELGLTRSRWGWQNGPLGPGSYTQPIYAGAAQNDISKGALVGQLSIGYDGASVTVSYNITGGYVLDETHLYVGTSNVGTISPGQFGNTHDLQSATSDSFTVGGFSGQPIYVVAHAVACH